MEPKPIKMPDITAAQIVALIQPFITATIGLLAAFNLPVTDAQATAISGFVLALAAFISGAIVIADAIIRNGRSRVLQNPPKPPVETPEKLTA